MPASTKPAPAQPTIEYLILADHAQQVDGKLYMLGGGFASHTPQRYPSLFSFFAVVGLSMDRATAGYHELTLDFLGPNRNQRGGMSMGFTVTPKPNVDASIPATAVIIGRAQMVIDAPGIQTITARIGRRRRSVVFECLPPVEQKSLD